MTHKWLLCHFSSITTVYQDHAYSQLPSFPVSLSCHKCTWATQKREFACESRLLLPDELTWYISHCAAWITTAKYMIESQNSLGWKAPFKGHPVQPRWVSRDIFNQVRLRKAPSNLALNVSKDRVSTTFLGNCFSVSLRPCKNTSSLHLILTDFNLMWMLKSRSRGIFQLSLHFVKVFFLILLAEKQLLLVL